MCNTNSNCPSIKIFYLNINKKNEFFFNLFWKGLSVSIWNKRLVLIESTFIVVIIDDGGGNNGCSIIGRFKTEPKR